MPNAPVPNPGQPQTPAGWAQIVQHWFANNWRQCIAAVVASLVFYLFAVEYLPWSEWRPFEVQKRPKWKNDPVELKAEKVDVLTKLLHEDREEIRYWQDKLFTISFLFSAAIVGIVAFTIRAGALHASARYVFAIACLALSVFYLVFVEFAQGAIGTNDYDLIGIQFALRLSTPNEYLNGGQVIYQAGDPLGHFHIRQLVRFNVVLVIVAVNLLLFLPLQQVQNSQKEGEH